jgi:DNA-3-methyladenine glycosylase I
MKRCEWCGNDPLYIEYHDKEWGVPVHDDRKHFEFLILETMQAGLSWITILKKRENFRTAFDDFDPQKVAKYDESKFQALLRNPGIIRNKLKIQAAIQNARAFLQIQEEFETFDQYIWQFVDGKPIHNQWKSLKELPAKTPLAEKISKDLKNRGFSFVGPTIIYAHMQAIGLVNDHVIDCFRYEQIVKMSQE